MPEKNKQEQSLSNDYQGESLASSSGTNPAISEEEREEEKSKYFRYYSQYLLSELKGNSSINISEIRSRVLAVRDWKLSLEMTRQISAEVESLLFKVESDSESDSSDSEIDWEETEEEQRERAERNSEKITKLLEE